MRHTGTLAALALAVATTLALAPTYAAHAATPEPTVSYAMYVDSASDTLGADLDGLQAADNADYEADSPYCTAAELTPTITAYACLYVPLAEAGPYADDTSYDVAFTDDGELATLDGAVLDQWRWTLA